MRCAVYLRISEDDGVATSIERQQADCEAHAARHGWTIAATYTDRDLSAFQRKVKRPAYDAMFAEAAAGAYDLVLVWKFDRLNRRHLEAWLDLAEAGTVHLTSVNDPSDTTTATGRAVLRMVAAFAQLESEQISMRVARQIREAAENGKPRNTRGRSFGYTDTWELEPAETAAIKAAAVAVLAGATLGSVAAAWNTAGLLSPSGAQWQRSTVQRLLAAPRTGGWRVHRGRIVARGQWAPILDEITQRRLVALFADPARRTPRGNRVWLLSGLARCAECGAALHGGHASSGNRDGSPRRKYLRYRCARCGRASVRAEQLEEYVIGLVLDASSGDLGSTAATPDDTEVRTVEQRLADLAGMWAAGDIEREEWLTARTGLTARLAAARGRLAAAERRAGAAALGDLSAVWPALSPEARKAVLRAVVAEVVVSPVGRGARVPVAQRVEVRWVR